VDASWLLLPRFILRVRTQLANAQHLLCLIFLIAWPVQSRADLLPAQNATLSLIDSSIYVVVSTPVSALTGIDDNADGLISNAEMTKHSADIQNQFQKRFSLTDEGNPGTPVLTLVNDPGISAPPAGYPYLVILQRINFTRPPTHLLLTTDLFGTKKGEDKLTLTATLGKPSDANSRTEVVILDSGHASQRLFAGGWETFNKFIQIGIDHILSGRDHLLFLLTIIVAAAGWRYWLSVVTSFTIAHSITLTLSVLGTIRVEASLVEQAIAASIILMAAHNLLRQGTHTRGLVPMVFGCGLLHGLGFASALSEMGLDSAHRLATLAGFNVGVECGQFMFLLSVIYLMTLLRYLMNLDNTHIFSKAASAIAAVLGIIMLVQRTEFLNQLADRLF
jgi:hydrogenase/urease accessory protein HupE